MIGRSVPATFIDGPLDGTTWRVPLVGEPGRPPTAITVDRLVYSLSHGAPEAGWVYDFTRRSRGS